MLNQTVLSKAISKWLILGLWLVGSFFIFDRLLFLLLREGAARYYASLGADTLKFKKTEIYGSGDGDILIFGTSRARRAFAQDILSVDLNKRIIKEASAGKFPRYNYYYYQKYRTIFPKPKFVLYGLDYFIFRAKSNPAELARLDKRIKLPKMNPRGKINPASIALSRISWLFRMKPEVDGFLGEVLKFDRDSEVRDEEAPLAAKKPGRKKGRAFLKIRQGVVGKQETWQTREYQNSPGEEGIYLEKLLEDMDRDDVTAFLVIIPDYMGTNDTNFEQDKFKSDIRALASRFKNAYVLDFNKPDRFDLNDLQYFRDGGWGKSNCHLSVKGMNEFSRKLAMEIKRILHEGKAGSKFGNGPET